MPSQHIKSEMAEPHGSAIMLSMAAADASRGRRKLVVMVGTHLTKTRGGITTLNESILSSRLADDFEIKYIASQAEDFGTLRKLLLAIISSLRFCAVCLFQNPSAAYVHIGSNASLYRESAFVALAKLFGLKVISHFHAGDVDKYLPVQSALGRRFISLAMNLSDRYIAVSSRSKRQLEAIVPTHKIKLIPTAIDINRLGVDRRAGDRTHEPAKILFVGAMGKLKGERDLADAVKKLSAEEQEIRVSFVGHGAENVHEYCREIGIVALVDHIGPISMTERTKYFGSADIFVLPTYAEAMPISVIEAMAAGLPVVSTTAGGIPELITDGVDGLLIEHGDVAALAEKILYLVRNREARIQIGQRAQATIRKKMDFTFYIDRLRAELELLSAPRTEIPTKRIVTATRS